MAKGHGAETSTDVVVQSFYTAFLLIASTGRRFSSEMK